MRYLVGWLVPREMPRACQMCCTGQASGAEVGCRGHDLGHLGVFAGPGRRALEVWK